MRTTLSVIKADIGSIGGHIKPSAELLEAVVKHVRTEGKTLVSDVYVSSTGDDIAILMAHKRGTDDERIHKLAWDAFVAGTKVAKAQGLYGAGHVALQRAGIRGHRREYEDQSDGWAAGERFHRL